MHKISIIILILALNIQTSLAQKSPKDKFIFSEFSKINSPNIKKVTLQNGIRIILLEDKRYPTLDIQMLINSGSVFDPKGKEGTAVLAGSVIRSGGSDKYPGNLIDEKLEKIAASIESGMEDDFGYVSSSMLIEHTDKVIPIFADILMNPVFPEDKIKLEKNERLSFIARRNDNPRGIIAREFEKIVYGKDNLYSRNEEIDSIRSITRKDLSGFHKKYYKPENVVIAVWGSFDSESMEKKLTESFGKWKNIDSAKIIYPKVMKNGGKEIGYIEKKDMNQVNITLGHIGGMISDDDYPVMTILNKVLSFERLFKKLRTNEGLAYSVWGNYGAGYRTPGIFSVGIQTKSETCVKSLKMMLHEISEIKNIEINDAELLRAKEQIINGFIFEFESNSKIARKRLTYEFFGYPDNFSDLYLGKIRSITKRDILEAAKRNIDESSFKIIVLGDKEKFDEPIEQFGNVVSIDIVNKAAGK